MRRSGRVATSVEPQRQERIAFIRSIAGKIVRSQMYLGGAQGGIRPDSAEFGKEKVRLTQSERGAYYCRCPACIFLTVTSLKRFKALSSGREMKGKHECSGRCDDGGSIKHRSRTVNKLLWRRGTQRAGLGGRKSQIPVNPASSRRRCT